METNEKKLYFTPINNHILEKMLKTRFTECELMILLCIFRHTAGWQRPYYNMSYSFIAEDIKHTTRAVRYALKNLEKRNIIVNYKKPGGKVNIWGINASISMWDREQPFLQKIKDTSQDREQPFLQDREQPFLIDRNNHSYPIGTTIPTNREQPFLQKINNKKNYKESTLKKEEPTPKNNNLEKDIEIFLRNMERLENDETSGTI